MTIAEIKALRETEGKVEFKEGKDQYAYRGKRRSLLGYVVAFANEKGGRLIFGVKENKGGPHDIVGSKAWEGREGKLVEDIYRDLNIRITTEVLFEGSNRVMVIHIPSRPVGKAMKFDDVPLMRVGEELLPMSDDQLFKILQEQEPDFSATICEGLTIADLDPDAIAKMKERYSIKQNNPSFRVMDTVQVLSDLRLTDNGRFTYAALILLGKQTAIQRLLPQACVTWEFRFSEGQTAHDFRENICLPLFLGIDDIWGHINGKNAHIQVREAAYITDLNVFNEEVIREALLNAITHRDYTVTSEVVIKQYPRKMIINNPGGFPKGVTLENLLTVSSTPRSRLMAEVLEKTGLVERSGQGIDKIYSLTLSEGKPMPSYEDSDMLQVSLRLTGAMEDTAFHVFISRIQKSRKPEDILGAELIIALYKVKTGQFATIKPDILQSLERQSLIVRASGHAHTQRYLLAEAYTSLAARQQQIGKRYLTQEIEQVLFPLQGTALKPAELAQVFSGGLTRNQLKFLISKLSDDGILSSEGKGRATKYKLAGDYEQLRGDGLIDAVLATLREKYSTPE